MQEKPSCWLSGKVLCMAVACIFCVCFVELQLRKLFSSGGRGSNHMLCVFLGWDGY